MLLGKKVMRRGKKEKTKEFWYDQISSQYSYYQQGKQKKKIFIFYVNSYI